MREKHLDRTEMLEILYLNQISQERSQHLSDCSNCDARLLDLRNEIESDRAQHRGRVETKPDSFWTAQREEIMLRASRVPRRSFRFGGHRLVLPAVMALLLVVVGLTVIPSGDATAPANTGVQQVETETLFGGEDLRELDPWQSDELESFHQVVEWEDWIEEKPASGSLVEEES